MELNLKEISVASMVLFAVIDIIGSIPLVIKIKTKAGVLHPTRATLVALCIMVAFLFLGESILAIIGITPSEFSVAGSFIIFFMAIEMVLGIELFQDKNDHPPGVASIVPLAFPLIAGAGTMTSIISLRAEFAQINVLVAIIVNMLVVWTVLKLSSPIERILGKAGIAVLEKVFGVILLAIAVKLFSNNVPALF